MYVSMYFKIMPKVVKYNYFNIIFFLILREGGAKFNFAPGRLLPSLRHCFNIVLYIVVIVLHVCVVG